jgi:muramidase (phage lysozyme)
MKDKRLLSDALSVNNVKAILRVIREKESNQNEDAYKILNGGAHFDSFLTHPGYKGGPAAGAYQFVWSTWQDVVQEWNLLDFSPENQDLGAVARIIYRGALADVLSGNFILAIEKLRKEWTSLPGASESHATWTMEKAKEVYLAYGGLLSTNVPVPEVPANPAAPPLAPQLITQQGEKKMPILALLATFGPILGQLIPQIAKVLNPSSEKTVQNLSIAQTVLDTVVKAANATNVQDAVEKLQASPPLVQAVTKQIVNDPQIVGLLEIGGGIEKARQADQVATQAEKPFWFSQAFWITLLVITPPVDYMVYAVISRMAAPSEQLVTQLVTGLLGLMAVAGAFYFGTTYGNKQKDDTINTLVKS